VTGPLLLLAALAAAAAEPQVEKPAEQPAGFSDPTGRRAFALVPVAVCLQPQVVGLAGPKPPAPVSEAERRAFDEDVASVARFFWVNSGMRLALAPLVLVADARTPAAAEAPDFPKLLEAAKRPPSAGALRVTAIFQQEWQPQAKLYALAPGEGEKLLASREPHAGFGSSWFRMDEAATGPLVRHLYRQLRHALSVTRVARLPPEGLGPSGRSGDGLDALAQLLREQPAATWAAVGRELGRLADAPDRDGDGVPDQAADAPLDEERFGSDPAKPDTDGDGLSDFDEARARIWIDRGQGCERGGPMIVPDPRKPDSDGDGVADGRDPEPLFPFPTRLEPGKVTIDGKLEAKEWDPLGRIDDRDMKAGLFTRLSADGLGLAARLDRLGWVQLQLDGAGDGWYRGRDNIGISLYWQSHTKAYAAFPTVWDAATPGRAPGFDASLIERLPKIVVATRPEGEGWVVEAWLPKCEALGFAPAPGRRVRLSAAVFSEAAMAEHGKHAAMGHHHGLMHRHYLTLLEPHTMIALELAGR
jgi:hypothetical protein